MYTDFLYFGHQCMMHAVCAPVQSQRRNRTAHRSGYPSRRHPIPRPNTNPNFSNLLSRLASESSTYCPTFPPVCFKTSRPVDVVWCWLITGIYKTELKLGDRFRIPQIRRRPRNLAKIVQSLKIDVIYPPKPYLKLDKLKPRDKRQRWELAS